MPKVHGSGTHSNGSESVNIQRRFQIYHRRKNHYLLFRNPLNTDLVKEIYESELSSYEFRGFSLGTSYDMILMINEKSLENDIVCQTVLKPASLRVWSCLSHVRFQMEMCLDSNLIKKWHKMIKKQSEEAEKRGEPFDLLSKPKVRFVKNLIEEFLEKQSDHVDNQFGGSEQVDNGFVPYCERFLRPVVADVAVVPKCHLSALYNHPKRRLFARLVDLLQLYKGFEINDHTGTQLSDYNVVLVHHFLIEAFQFLASKKVHKLKLASSKDPWAKRVDFLLEVMVSFLEKHQSQKEAINALPLYPNEQIMWDESLLQV
ncbi:hypothetical protein C5167_026994 [Papaver somniferum]|nr:hypothetical protein C5167_026994 [Papaver somniferum]